MKLFEIERIGTDGDMQRAARLYQELDGKVDAFGVGGADLGLMVAGTWYPLYSARPLVRYVQHTPVVDGTGLKTTLERRAAAVVEAQIGKYVREKKVFIVTAVDRWGVTRGFIDAGYECVLGDMMFTLGLPIALHSERGLRRAAACLMPVAGRLPFKWVYPTGKQQEKHTPKWEKYFQWATIIAGDCHYINRYMPERLAGKVIVTNTTTPDDVACFQKAGVKYLVTTTPVLEGRSFGTNMMEAALIAAAGRTQPVDYARAGDYFEKLEQLLERLHFEPQVQELN